MSAIKVDTQNINIEANKIAGCLIENKHYDQYNNEVIKKITFEVIDRLNKSFSSNEGIFDDEELFDATYDYMLKKLSEVFSTADIAYIVNDIFMQMEDVLFDEGMIEYAV